MLSWQWPALFVLLPIPLIVRWLSRRDDVSSTAIQVPFFDALQNLDQAQVSP
jgi:Ca-activated chloride channel family protein